MLDTSIRYLEVHLEECTVPETLSINTEVVDHYETWIFDNKKSCHKLRIKLQSSYARILQRYCAVYRCKTEDD